MELLKYVGTIVQKKEVQGENDKTYLSYKIGFLGFFLDVERTERNFNDFKEGDLVEVAIFAKPSSAKTEYGTYNFSIPEVIGLNPATDINQILVVPRGDIQVLKCDLIKMKDQKDPNKEISYTKLLLAGDINGEITGSKDVILKNMTKYTALMTLGIKKGQLQFLPSDYKEVEKKNGKQN